MCETRGKAVDHNRLGCSKTSKIEADLGRRGLQNRKEAERKQAKKQKTHLHWAF